MGSMSPAGELTWSLQSLPLLRVHMARLGSSKQYVDFGLTFIKGAAWLRGRADSQVPLHITVPQRVLSNTTGEMDTQSYILSVEGRPYTIHLKQQFFLPADFSIYTYNETGSLRSDSPYIKGDCYYRGYIEGIPGSAVTLSTCMGLRGLLQFHNASYGIEPLGSSPSFQHVVYPVSTGAAVEALLPHGHLGVSRDELAADGSSDTAQPALKLLSRHRREVLLHVVLERSLYRHLGDDQYIVSQKVVQLISFLDNMFSSLNVTVTLSSMEVWRLRNKIQTTGAGEMVLLRFLDWKRSNAILRHYVVPYLLMYRDQADFVGATSPGMLCRRHASAAVAVLQHAVTLESFSVVLAQLLGRSLGMGFDDGRGCHCPTHTCVMESRALRIGGAKTFSSCSAADLEQFLWLNPECPFLSALQLHPDPRAAVCGNGVVEHDEQCDCGGDVACAADACCTTQCKLKPGSECSLGLCCAKCQFKAPNTPCRPPADAQCDLPEFCNGSSASCPPDVYVQDGHSCEHSTGYCYHGRCKSAELQCQRLYGRGAKNAPLACYEEINSHQDRFGHCGNRLLDGYQPCSWPNLGCGKLICTYPNHVPFTKLKGAIIYAQVQEHLCVSFDVMHAPSEADPLLVKDGTKCGPGKVCMNGTCHPHSILNYDCNAEKKCHGHGVCNNKKNCHCQPGWKPPHCSTRGSALGGSTDSGQRLREMDSHAPKVSPKDMKNALLLSFCLLVPILICIVILIMKWSRLMRRCARSEMEAADSADEEISSIGSNESSGSSRSSRAGMEPEPERGSGALRPTALGRAGGDTRSSSGAVSLLHGRSLRPLAFLGMLFRPWGAHETSVDGALRPGGAATKCRRFGARSSEPEGMGRDHSAQLWCPALFLLPAAPHTAGTELMVRLHCFQRDCFYEGYVEGFPGSLVALSTCSGLSGILQLANTSYGIKPLEAASGYQHLVYQMEGENVGTQPLGGSSSLAWAAEVSLQPWDGAAKEAVPKSPRYLEMHIILDKALYDYMGADKYVVTTKMVQLFSYVNSVSAFSWVGEVLQRDGKDPTPKEWGAKLPRPATVSASFQMFARLNLTIVLTSLELWTEKNKIQTTGAAEELLQRFLQWKSTHRTSQLQDITFLFVYREQSYSMGASSARKLCLKDRAGGVALLLLMGRAVEPRHTDLTLCLQSLSWCQSLQQLQHKRLGAFSHLWRRAVPAEQATCERVLQSSSVWQQSGGAGRGL
ncbi:disintegrin and metalloproteinase domain-containing protein 2-like [Centrocercus urophasianus]|uniref:disintegrin and metalloproteinase domain-containing protein 2-like n=1 Tax=Centrocercus urophasianus TaxID=9002 RepID=UPI001C64B136|nr:disintegrin and metalloproteinase domain-containing protein 2-like [Centrocercus urophasianus]